MLKIKLNTGEVLEVTRNVAHDLVERGKGALYKTKQITKKKTRQMTASRSKRYKTK